jgi:hypothetical protein
MRPAKAGRIFYSLQAATRIICPPMAGKFHTCGLRGIFRHAQVAAENDLNLFRRGAAKLCEAFFLGGAPLPPL